SLHAGRNHESRNLSPAVVARPSAREHRVEIRDTGIRNKSLAAVDDIGILFQARRGLNGSYIRTGVGFGQGKSSNGLAIARACEPKVAHVLSRRQTDRIRAQSLHHE